MAATTENIVRYTRNGNYDQSNSGQAYYGMGFSDPAYSYHIYPDQGPRGARFFEVDATRDDGSGRGALYDESFEKLNPSTDGLYLDFSHNAAEVELTGGDMDDVLIGGMNFDRLNGGAGDDLLVSGPGYDFFDGGDGVDTLVVRGGRDFTYVVTNTSEKNIERILVQQGTSLDLHISSSTFQSVRIVGRIGAAVIGAPAADHITGGGGDDRITGGGGADILLGAGGADTFVYRASGDFGSAKSERILDFSGVGGEGDRIDLSALGITGVHKGAFAADGTAQLRIVEGANGFSTLTFDLGGDGTRDATLRVRADAALTAADFVFAASSSPQMAAPGPDTLGIEYRFPAHTFIEAFHPYAMTALV